MKQFKYVTDPEILEACLKSQETEVKCDVDVVMAALSKALVERDCFIGMRDPELKQLFDEIQVRVEKIVRLAR